MSLSNPHEKGQPNPSTRWFEWNGEQGKISYYDKDAKQTMAVTLPFTFILLDELAGIRGWHDASQSGIYSNEVKDTRQDALIVKAFKGGTLAEGVYRDIKDRVNALGGSFSTNCYFAFKNENNDLNIGSLRFKGSALNAWMDFRKQHRNDFYSKAVRIDSFTEGKKGRIVYRVPTFAMTDISPETITMAVELDKTLQEFLKGYLSRNKKDQTEVISQTHNDLSDPTSTMKWIRLRPRPFRMTLTHRSNGNRRFTYPRRHEACSRRPGSWDALQAIRPNEVLTASLRRARHPGHHRKLFALLNLVFENQDKFTNIQELLNAIKLATGYFELGKTIDGIPFCIPKSIAFASMCEAEFTTFFDKAVDVILTKILPGVNRDELNDQVQDILNGRNGQ